jgi:hypothetical protein
VGKGNQNSTVNPTTKDVTGPLVHCLQSVSSAEEFLMTIIYTIQHAFCPSLLVLLTSVTFNQTNQHPVLNIILDLKLVLMIFVASIRRITLCICLIFLYLLFCKNFWSFNQTPQMIILPGIITQTFH